MIHKTRSSKERRDQLNIEIKSGNKEDRRESQIEFENEMLLQRLITMGLMLLVLLFFFIYFVVFCAVYKNSQASLMYSGIWALLFVWIVLAPVFIVGISLVEFKINRGCTYYFKRLFLFNYIKFYLKFLKIIKLLTQMKHNLLVLLFF